MTGGQPGPDSQHRPPGRPVIGNYVKVPLGDLLPEVERWAESHGRNRAEALRILLGIGLGHPCPDPAGKTPAGQGWAGQASEGESCP